jgi:hypothetical protein
MTAIWWRQWRSVTDMPDEAVDVLHQGGKAWTVSALARRAAVTTRVPGEHREVIECEFVDDMLQSSRMLVTAVQQQHRPLGIDGRPAASSDRTVSFRRG